MTERWIGEIDNVFDDGDFNATVGPTFDERPWVVQVPSRNVTETERSKIVPCRRFYCDIEFVDEVLRTVRGIEFIEPDSLPSSTV